MYSIKCILIGTSNVGKSSLFMRLLHDKYISEYQSTIGVDYGEKKIKYNDENYKVQIWDTAGQERFESITSSFYRNTNCVLYCFSIDNKYSLIKLQKYIDSFRRINPEETLVLEILIGLCCDLPPEVTSDEINKFQKDNDIDLYYPVSSKDNINISKLLNIIMLNAKKYSIKKEIKYIEQLDVIEPKQKINDSCCGNNSVYVPYAVPHTYYL